METTEFTHTELDIIKKVLLKKTGNLLESNKYALDLKRLKKHIKEVNANNLSEYLNQIAGDKSEEIELFVNALTRNGTYFFRHPRHFEFIKSTVIPEIMYKKAHKNIKIWSAACSTGEEPYSIAMLCKEILEVLPKWTPTIIASDINSNVLAVAKCGSYYAYSLKVTPQRFDKFFKKVGISGGRDSFLVSPEIKQMVLFMQHNLLNKFEHSNIDIVFLRNVMVYFPRDVKEKVVQHIYDAMNTRGYLFTSLADTLDDIKTKFKYVEPGIYMRVL